MANFIKPISRVSEDEANQGSLVFQPSSRIKALLSGSSKSIGASCNVFSLDDSIASIADGHSWAYHVLSYQGAPSVDFSNLRPRDSKLGSGGKSSGAVSFMKPFDAIVSTMRREEKKNGAGIAYLDYRHPELDSFLELKTDAAYKAVYLPMHDTPEAEELLANADMMQKLAKAYDYFKCFLVKRPLPFVEEHFNYADDVTPLYINLCTEVEIPHKGFCILGAINLSYFTEDNLHLLPAYFKLAVQKMYDYMCQSESAANLTPLACDSVANRQFGLGVFGLASLLGRLGITYREFARELEFAFSEAGADASIHGLASLYDLQGNKYTLVSLVVSYLLQAYSEATKLMEGKVRAAFCIQPTVSTAQRSFDCEGYHASPEIQPVQGLKNANAVSTIIKSEIKGDKRIDYHPQTWTLDEVPYEDYALVSSLWQRVLDSTGLAHRHSHCFYGSEFTVADLRNFYEGDLRYRKSLYYRLPFNVNPESLNKSRLWQDVAEGELFDADLSDLFGQQVKGVIECECTM